MGRGWRLEMVLGLGIAAALPAAAQSPAALATQTTLAAETQDVNGQTHATLTARVTGEDGGPASGTVVIEEGGRPLAGAALAADGSATTVVSLPPGEHSLQASYSGDATHKASLSRAAAVSALTSTQTGFTVSVNPATVTAVQGETKSVQVTITPTNPASLSAPMFVTLSLTGLPDQSSATFTPESLEIQPNTASAQSNLVITTVASNVLYGSRRPSHSGPADSSPVQWAILLPGALLGLAGVAFGARRGSRALTRLSLLGLVALVTILGTAGCSPLYNYRNHGPNPNLPTPAGTYTLQVAAQSSDGVSATTNSVNMVLTVTSQ